VARQVSSTTQTRTYQLANHLAKFPAVQDTAQVDLHYSTSFYEKTHRGPKPKGFIRKAFELLNPFKWSLAFWFALFSVAAVSYVLDQGLLQQMKPLRTPIFSQPSILTALRINYLVMVSLLLLVFHFNLNYRRRGPGRLIKAYWYAMWTAFFFLSFSPPASQATLQHRANQLNHFCFNQKDTARCERYKKTVYRSNRRDDLLKDFPTKRRAMLAQTFKTWDAERAAESAEEVAEEPAIQKRKDISTKKKVAARQLEHSRRWAYTH